MLTRLARLSTQHARAVVIAAVVLFAVAGALGGGVADHLTSGGFEDPSSESERADEALADRFDTGVPNLLLLVTAEDGDVDDPAAAQAGQALADRLAGEEGVTDVVSYWSEGNAPPLRNDDGSRALVVARIEGNDDEVEDRVTELTPRYERAAGAGNGTIADAISVEAGGFAEVFHEVGDTIEEDLVRAETIALPITLVLLVIVFGSLVAASLPLVIGIMSIIGTFFVLRVLAAMTDVSIYALNLTTALGLGLAIN
jgi:putative drug exporter of the RND superfamily